MLMDPAHLRQVQNPPILIKSSPFPDIHTDSVLQLDRDIEEILRSEGGSSHDKALRYQQLLEKYLRREQYQNRKSTPWPDVKTSELNPIKTEDGTSDSRVERRVIETVPVTLQKKARLLIDHLKDLSDLTWNERGELLRNGNPIPGSHLSDLVNDAIRNRKTKTKPIGWEHFYKAVKASNVPQELIGHREDRFKDAERSVSQDRQLSLTPKTSKSRKPSRSSSVRRSRKRTVHKTANSWSPY